MPPAIKHFPSGKWQVLFGGHVQLGTAPIPERTYYVPLMRIAEVGQPCASSFVYAKAGLGDLPFITPGAIFENGKRIQVDSHESFSITIYTGKEAYKNERTLGQFLKVFTAESDPSGYFHALRSAVERMTALADAPIVAFKATSSNLWVVAPASEWYRQMYGLTEYLAHTFLMHSFEEMENRLVVRERTRIVSTDELDHPSLQNFDNVLGVVPRTRVPDRCAPLYASIKLPTGELGDVAQRNALHAAQSIMASAASGSSGPHWLRFGHPYPDRNMPVVGKGIKGKVATTNKDEKQKATQVIFLTSLILHTHPPGIPYCILERENDGNSLAKLGEDKALPCDESETRTMPRFESAADGEQDYITVTPDANPRAGQIASRYEGAPFDETGAPPIIKLERRGKPDPSLIRYVEKRDFITDRGEKTTNQMSSRAGEAGPAFIDPKINSEMETSESLAALMSTLNRLEASKTIRDLRPVNYFPSEFAVGGITLQQFPYCATSERWLQMPDRDCKRLLLAVRFEYRSSLFIILDAERKGTESFSFMLARYASGKIVDDSTLNTNIRIAVEKLRDAKGVLGKAEIDAESFQAQSLKHQKEIYESIVHVRLSYVLSKMNLLITESLPE